MFRNIFIFIVVVFVLFISGCSTFDKYVPPSQQCFLLKQGARIGIKIGAKKVYAKEKIDKYISVLKEKVLKLLSKPDKVKSEEWENALEAIDKEFDSEMKIAIAGLLNNVFAMLDGSSPVAKDMTLGERFKFYAKCLFEGIVEGLTKMIGTKDIKHDSMSLKTLFKKYCKICLKDKCKKCD